ncbi:hypothetical protein WR25_00891 [Diploscapter pachys]|uniref:PARG helical domain-containing protein n=1 Tax=Diploscapter pachys TaxID=2018661 RepID=A0A2A2KVH5_9BILA|nr:hypothetical protein WR25_00891 [Diploscapter pachys]
MENKSRNSKLPADAEDILDFDAETAALPDLNDSANLNHIVLVELPATSDSPPKPHANPRLEFEKFTPPILSHFPELPWGSSAVASSRSKDKPYPNEYWSNVIKSIDNFISLDESKIKIGDIMEFIRKMLRNESDKRFYALEKFFGQTPEEEQAKIVRTIKGIAQLVKRGPELFPKGIPMLKQVPKCKVRQFYPEAQILDCNMTMSQEQCAVLLANAFFGTFSQSKRENNYNRLSFVGIFCGTHKQTISKLHFTFEYFSRVLESMPTGVVSFRRISYGRTITSERRKQLCTDKISDCTLSVSSTEKIEEFDSHRHMDFSNSYIGGGVLGPMGSAQVGGNSLSDLSRNDCFLFDMREDE